MGLYFRKAVRVGPFRFNLSQSGIGVSTGIRGLRIGTGPRGNYVHAGLGGVYYRATLPGGQSSVRAGKHVHDVLAGHPVDSGDLRQIDSIQADRMQDVGAEEVLAELRAKRKLVRAFPWAAGTGIIFCAILVAYVGGVGFLLGIPVMALTMWAARHWDAVRKSTVLLYDLSPEMARWYDSLGSALMKLQDSERVWYVDAIAVLSSAAKRLNGVQRGNSAIGLGAPPWMRCNLSVPYVNVGRQTLYFLPERVLVFDDSGVGSVPYAGLEVVHQTVQLTEPEAVPGDAHVVGRTWTHARVDGGPDRRFRNNPAISTCQYDIIHLSSTSGLNEMLCVSRDGLGRAFVEEFRTLLRSSRSRPGRSGVAHST